MFRELRKWSTGLLPVAVAGLLIALTWLMAQGAAPDPALHERTLGALRAIQLSHAALDRDILRARAGLLRNYDPLVSHINEMHEAVATLQAAASTATEIRPDVEGLVASVAEKEAAVESFKSRNALLQNSLSYFGHTTREFERLAGDTPDALAAIGALGNATLRFLNGPQGENAFAVRAALDRVRQMPLSAVLEDRAEALATHGGIVLTTLPAVDDIVRGLLAPTLVERTRTVQDAYLAQHARAAGQAAVFRGLLYVLSVLLALYLGHLFLRLRQHARALQEQREVERRLEMQLHQAQRLEAIGTLAGGIAHEFNNVLGGILGYAEMLLDSLPRAGRSRHYVEQIMSAGRRAKGIVDQILDFSRRSDRRHSVVAVQPAVEEALALLRATLPATLTLRARIEAGQAAVVGDPGQLQQVAVNLCTNAAQASDGRGEVDLALDTVNLDQERIVSHGRLAAGPYVRLSVRDRGHGIDSATMDRIFEPFFTTKSVGVGTGLGLSTVHGIVAQHGGVLNVSSRPGEGSTFEVYLPQADELPAAEQHARARLVGGQGETILLVDDERPLMLLAEEMLAALGYEPVGFDDSVAALAAFRADPRRFDLVLTDEIMPSMTGTELAAAVHETRPELPVVIMTGYSGPLAARRLQARGIREVLKKPLLSADIAESLARNLAARVA